MPIRDRTPPGAPCWAELMTPDVETARRFYSEVLGWTAGEPQPEFGGYVTFTLHDRPVAGCMAAMPDAPPVGVWTIYLATGAVDRTVADATANAAEVMAGPEPVADLGRLAVLTDPTGATVGAWEAGTFPGITVFDEPGAPSWFELHTRDHPAAVRFYETVFDWRTRVESDTDEFRYVTMRDPDGTTVEYAGIMDATGHLPDDAPSHWVVYWDVEDVDRAVDRATAAGGTVVHGAVDTPYGRLAALVDPTGAGFRVRTHPPA